MAELPCNLDNYDWTREFQEALIGKSAEFGGMGSHEISLDKRKQWAKFRGRPCGTKLSVTHNFRRGKISNMPDDFTMQLQPGEFLTIVNNSDRSTTKDVWFTVDIAYDGPIWDPEQGEAPPAPLDDQLPLTPDPSPFPFTRPAPEDGARLWNFPLLTAIKNSLFGP